MKTVLKRAVMHAYVHGWISSRTVEKLFYRFDLKGQ